MSLFTKTVVVQGGLTKKDAAALIEVFEAVGERLHDQDKEIAELREEIAALKRKPRQSLRAKLRSLDHD